MAPSQSSPGRTELRPFDPLRALRTLNREGVRFVIIGGFGGRLLGSPTVTNDLEICYARDRENLEALVRALRRLHADLRGAPPGLPFQWDADAVAAGDHFTFLTDVGALDCMATPSGVSGYAELEVKATALDLDGLMVMVASIEDLIRMKQASARPKDLIEAEVLGALRDEIEEQRRSSGRR
jgi:hypothetical protein